MKKSIKTIAIVLATILLSSYTFKDKKATYSLTIDVKDLRNSKGVVQFALYNKDGSIPDFNYTKYYKKSIADIKDSSSSVTFENLPAGKYAVNILHDENKNGKIDKGFILPKEGIGFSNFQAIKITNRPNFSKASFELKENKKINIKVIYM